LPFNALLATYFHDGFLIGLFFDPEDGGNMFLPNVGWLSTLYMLPPAFTMVSCSAYSSTLKMETLCSSERSVDFQRFACRLLSRWFLARHIPRP
jgi:hypothetical protein